MKRLYFVLPMLAAVAVYGAPTQYTVVKGDHLWALAGTYYQNHFRWKVIFAANRQKIKDPNLIYPGQVFVIPDVPGPEIGEVGARPVETAEAVAAPAPASDPAPAPPPEPARSDDRRDDLSADFPPQMTGEYPSMTRFKAPHGWKQDGRVVDFDGREIIAAQGDSINGKLAKGLSAAAGDRFMVYRRDAPQETEDDKKATYLQTVGEVEVLNPVGGRTYTFRVLKSPDAIELGDLLKREEAQ